MVETCPTEMIKKHCGEMFHSVMLGQNICSKYNRKRIQELEQRLRMSPIYQNEDCSPSPGVRQTPDDFKARNSLTCSYYDDLQLRWLKKNCKLLHISISIA